MGSDSPVMLDSFANTSPYSIMRSQGICILGSMMTKSPGTNELL